MWEIATQQMDIAHIISFRGQSRAALSWFFYFLLFERVLLNRTLVEVLDLCELSLRLPGEGPPEA